MQEMKNTDNIKKHRYSTYLYLLTVLLISLFLTSCKSQETVSFFAMDTYMSITAYGRNPKEALEEVKERILELEKLWDATDPDSEISKANREGYAKISGETAELIGFAKEIGKETDGALDITIYPVLKAWGFTTDNQQVPGEDEIKRLLETVGYERILIDSTASKDSLETSNTQDKNKNLSEYSITLPEDTEIELGAVGKGYTGDLVAKILKEKGIESAIIDLGGNIQTVGGKPDDTKSDGAYWKIGIKNPFNGEAFAYVQVKDKAVVTSGGYERYFEEDGKIYWHILDPQTGYPADSGLLSVTIVADSGALCDALSTALFVMGEEKAVSLWKSRQDFDFILVREDGTVIYTEGLKGFFEIMEIPGNINLSTKIVYLQD